MHPGGVGISASYDNVVRTAQHVRAARGQRRIAVKPAEIDIQSLSPKVREALQAIGGFDPELGAGTPFPCEDLDAIAAVLWAGFRGRFDPRPLVLHHHRRRLPDVPRLKAGYDRGRGAYYAKFLLRPECRRAYIVGWLRQVRRNLDGAGLIQLYREFRAAAAYLRSHRKIAALIAAALPAAALYGTAVLATGARAALKPRPDRSAELPS